MSSKAIIIENMVKDSVADIYIEYDLGLDYINNIFLSDKDYIELLEQDIKKYKKDLELLYFKTIEEASEYFNVPINRVKSRIKYRKRPFPHRGDYYYNKNKKYYWTISQALELTDPPQSYSYAIPKEITIDGKTFKSRGEACRYHNIAYPLVAGRLRKGWTNEEAYGVIPREKRKVIR